MFYLHHLLDIIRGKQCLIVTSTFLITTVQYLRIVMLIAIVVVVWPFIAIRITYQTLILSVSSAYFHAWPSLPSAVNNCCSLPPILNWIDARHGFPSSTLCCSFCQLFDAPYTIIGIDQICRSPGNDRMSQFCTVTVLSPWVLQKKNSSVSVSL